MSLIEVSGVTKQYGLKKALNNISLTFHPGKIVGILGENGCGKSTLFKVLTGMIQNYEGTVTIGDSPVSPKTKAMISYLPEKSYLHPKRKVSEYIQLFSQFYADFDEVRIQAILSDLGIDPKQTVGSFSKGNQEKIHLSLVMSRRSEIYILDEPIGGVDVSARSKILDLIIKNYQEDGLILISSHVIAEIEPLLEDVVFLKNGEVLLEKDVDLLRSEYGTGIESIFKEVY